jgi:hypothetical protein
VFAAESRIANPFTGPPCAVVACVTFVLWLCWPVRLSRLCPQCPAPLSAGAPLDHVSNLGWTTPLQLALRRIYLDMAEILEKAGGHWSRPP